MTKKNYIYLFIGIILFAVWCIDIFYLFSLKEIFVFTKNLYALLGPCAFIACAAEAYPDDK